MKKLLILFLILQPVLDISYTLNIFNINLIVRALFLVFIFIYLLKEKHYKPIIILLILIILYFLINNFYFKYSIFNNIKYIAKVFYLPITLIFFYYYKDDINDKYFIYTLILYLTIYYISWIFGIGNNIYENGIKKEGFKGLFNSINEFSAVIVTLFGISLNNLIKNKKYMLCIILSVLVAFLSMTLGTKVILGGLIILFLYFLYKPFKEFYLKKGIKTKILIIFSIIILAFISALLITNTTTYKNAEIQKKYFKANKFDLNYINKVIFNNRFSFISKNHKEYITSSLVEKLFGINRNIVRKDVEIDLFDIFYTYGLIGLMIILIYIIYIGYKSKLKELYLFLYMFLFLISETSGHVLISPSVSLYFGIIVYLNKNVKKKS